MAQYLIDYTELLQTTEFAINCHPISRSRFHIYFDSSDSNLKFGFDHTITESDPEHGEPVGTKVELYRPEQVFRADLKSAIENSCELFGKTEFLNFPPSLQLIIINMMFTVGYSEMYKNTALKNAITTAISSNSENDWIAVYEIIVDSNWASKIGERSAHVITHQFVSELIPRTYFENQ